MNKNMSLNNGLECNILIKADDISTDKINIILTKNKKMNISEENSKLFNKKNKINKNFLRKNLLEKTITTKMNTKMKNAYLMNFSKIMFFNIIILLLNI